MPAAGRIEAGEVVELIPALRAFARTFCRTRADADDLTQETLAKAIGNLHRFQPGTQLKSWLFTIMRNTFLSGIAKSQRELTGIEVREISASLDAPQEWNEELREVRVAMSRLPQAQREVLVLVGMLGVSYGEAAQICDCAVGTVKSRLSRARVALLAELDREARQ